MVNDQPITLQHQKFMKADKDLKSVPYNHFTNSQNETIC